jgi:hypothetical protein
VVTSMSITVDLTRLRRELARLTAWMRGNCDIWAAMEWNFRRCYAGYQAVDVEET